VKPARNRRKLGESPIDDDLLLTIFDKAAMGVAVADAQGQILTCNPALERMLGYTTEEWATRMIADAVHPDDLERVKAVNEELFSGRSEALVLEHRVLAKSGEAVWVRASVSLVRDGHGAPYRLIALLEDLSERRRAEREVSAARVLAEELLETTDAVIVQLSSSGEIEFVNGAFESTTGYTLEELKGRNWFEVLVPKDRYPDVREEFQRLTTGGIPARFENPILTKSGEERYIVWRNGSIEQDGGTVGTISIGIDITERRVAEEELADSEEKLQAVFTSAPAGMAVSNIESGLMFDANEEFGRIFECRLEDVVGKTSLGLGLWVNPEDRKRLIEAVKRDGHVEDFEAPLRTLTGRMLVALVNARLVTVRDSQYLIFATTDITERKQMEEQLALLKHSIDVHPDAAYWMESDARFFYVNDTACKAVGYEREELIGQSLSLIDTSATPEEMEAIWAELPHDHAYFGEAVHRRKDGSELPVEITATRVQFGGTEYFCSFARDISERKHAEEERALLAKQLQQAQKMEAVGRLAGGVAHSFNNILTALGGYCELLLAKLPEGSGCRPEAEQIKRASDHAAAITRELLLFSRREAAQRVRLDLNTVVVQSQLLLRELIRSDIKIVTALAPVVPLVLADHSQIEQVIINLVVNASDAMPGGGVITIETADIDLGEPLLSGDATLDAGRYVALVVSDSGAGMDESTLAHIFEPFFSTKGPEKGSGLGLATVYGIVEESGGRIHVDSKPGTGTKFTIFLPALPARG
jgi:PAS domain S-box-containing protein